MSRIQNVSPWGALEVPLLGRVVEPGEIVEVDPEHAEILLRQEANWADPDVPAPVEPAAAAETAQEPETGLSDGIKAVESAAQDGADAAGALKDASDGAKKKGVAEK